MVTRDIKSDSIDNKTGDNDSGTNTGLIAGLTTGLLVAAIIALTAGLLIYRKRKRAQMGVEKKPTAVETLPATSSDMILTDPSSTTSPPLSSVMISPPMASHQYPHTDEEARYIGSPLFIPSLSGLNQANDTTRTIQRSLTLSSKPSPSITINSTPINRSSSVKVTKYDHYPPPLDDDDLDHVQIRRAISVKRRNAAMAQRGLVTRSTSLRSHATHSRLIEDGSILPINNEEDDDDDDSDDAETTTAGSGAIQVVCAKPTIARIRSISRKDRKQPPATTQKTMAQVDDHQEQNGRMSMRSMPDSTHSSTLADGEITVYWQPPSN
ncbi:hypothetical protein BC941DRAFT_512613 [Chlamydoabsidia padenii]|nr:hypothetical protein BC941DRAFT_512613 [Chlamydoabsidia padenii]